MTDFDKLIKEKAEEATYSYKPSAWRNFQKSTGTFRPMKYWIAGAAVTVMVGTTIGVLMHQKTDKVPAQQEQVTVTAALDTLESPQNEQPVLLEEFENTVSPKNPSVGLSQKQSDQNTTTQPDAVVKQPNKESQTTTVRPLGRPLVIDVDTIKENVPTDDELRNGNSRIF